MTIVSYRVYCSNCSSESVVRRSKVEDIDWGINSLIAHDGLCPSCNPSVGVEELSDSPEFEESINLTELDNIGETAAKNLTEAGYDTVESIQNASDDELLDISWVGEKGLLSVREAANDLDPQKRWDADDEQKS